MLHRLGDLGVPPDFGGEGYEGHSVNSDENPACPAVRARLGARMIDGIEFLEPAGPGIEHQHDAYDGREGSLAGTEIPVSARIVAVAARFEALARELSDNDEAMRRVKADSGGRFDPEVVTALDIALQRHPWPPAEQVEEQGAPA
ncbi:MAG: HD-GYP domain-containing protein [Intrasporangium sp.]|uniref:HD-GYP domain-containing protein n=1 Tax=Intrasporangium sp. TaxID=1925024 RepID=UPI003F7EFE54